MGDGMRMFRDFESQVGDNWFWDDGTSVLEEDRVLYFAAFMFNRHVETLYESGRLQLHVSTDPIRALTGTVKHTSPMDRMWPEIVRDLPNPSQIAWGYSRIRKDYAGAASIEEVGGRVCVIDFPAEFNEVLQNL